MWLLKVSNHVHATRRLEASSCAPGRRTPGAVGVRVTQHGENTTTSSGSRSHSRSACTQEINYVSVAPPPAPAPLVSTRLTAYLACKGEATTHETRRGASRSLVEHRLHNLDVESNWPDMASQRPASCGAGEACSAPLWPILGGPCFRHRSQPIARWHRAG